MLKARRDAAMKVAESLFAAEEAIDVALAKVAEFNGTLATARTEAKLSAVVGQDAFETAASVFAALARARCDIVETHKRLSETKDQIGLRTLAIGDLGKPEEARPAGSGDGRHLQVVA
jgi:nitrogenase molybdenum-iron protein alpha/beta subunit